MTTPHTEIYYSHIDLHRDNQEIKANQKNSLETTITNITRDENSVTLHLKSENKNYTFYTEKIDDIRKLLSDYDFDMYSKKKIIGQTIYAYITKHENSLVSAVTKQQRKSISKRKKLKSEIFYSHEDKYQGTKKSHKDIKESVHKRKTKSTPREVRIDNIIVRDNSISINMHTGNGKKYNFFTRKFDDVIKLIEDYIGIKKGSNESDKFYINQYKVMLKENIIQAYLGNESKDNFVAALTKDI